ncbi:hypothetical protein [uncultured Allomuricauda sp.]|uniref:hypothetical protein n=1 Tax=Flagellimonas sp. W118 TaxID=3410791 RepID=UPI00262A7CB4|nr:hypothetical protein [uncultured Allomuricauda sp.]
MKIKQLAYLFLLVIYANTFGQTETSKEKEQYFDFWIGKWNATWDEGDGKQGKGINIVTVTLDGKSIHENFVVTEGAQKGFKGVSMSMYVPFLKRWKQSWNDNTQSYYDFTGEFEGDRRIFKTEPIKIKEKEVILRMVFHDIKKDSFTWDWEASIDAGKTWKQNWQIFYTRIQEDKISNLSPEKPDFTSLIGNWNCIVSNLDKDGNWKEANAKWEWKTILNGKVIQDYWESPTMKGINIRTFNPKTGSWMNAWVNDQNNSISEIWTANTKDDGTIMMTDDKKSFEIHFYNIKQDSFDWKWDVRQEDGSLKTISKIKGTRI